MHEILRHLTQDSRVLDLGSSTGSFDPVVQAGKVVQVDLEFNSCARSARFVCADAARLPFRDAAFDAIICNHSLEHFAELAVSLQEIGRVLRPEGSLFVSVPDATRLSDVIYRWFMAPFGGHVNLFSSAQEVTRLVEAHSRTCHVGTRLLSASFAYLNHRNLKPPVPPKKFALCFWGKEFPLLLFNALLPLTDRILGTRTSVYGWALYFGRILEPIDANGWINVCLRCGQGGPSAWLEARGCVRSGFRLLRLYTCPHCGARNYFSRDEAYPQLRGSSRDPSLVVRKSIRN
jgi:SAM-dependent methyltransferase